MHTINSSETRLGLSREFWFRMRENVDKQMYQSTSGESISPLTLDLLGQWSWGSNWGNDGLGPPAYTAALATQQSGENRKHWTDFFQQQRDLKTSPLGYTSWMSPPPSPPDCFHWESLAGPLVPLHPAPASSGY